MIDHVPAVWRRLWGRHPAMMGVLMTARGAAIRSGDDPGGRSPDRSPEGSDKAGAGTHCNSLVLREESEGKVYATKR